MPEDLLAYLRTEGYENLRVLKDGTVIGTHALLYTCALHINLDRYGWERRYCYPTVALARMACENLNNGDEPPMLGYVASRGT